jgi:hypothetical protein
MTISLGSLRDDTLALLATPRSGDPDARAVNGLIARWLDLGAGVAPGTARGASWATDAGAAFDLVNAVTPWGSSTVFEMWKSVIKDEPWRAKFGAEVAAEIATTPSMAACLAVLRYGVSEPAHFLRLVTGQWSPSDEDSYGA